MKPIAVGDIEVIGSDEGDGKDKTEPTLGDGDNDGGELDVDFVPDKEPLCTWSKDADEHRRTFIFYHLSSPDISGKILVENMELVFKWLKSGTMPNENGISPRLSPRRIPKESG